jgi:Predicted 3'-5' exonuclease related to the exonuclease domain of PolB
MGLPGKPDGISGAEVEKYFRDGHIQEIADYCESDVINTYRLWLRYELFRGRLAPISFETSEQNLIEFTSQKKSVSNSQTAQIIPGTQAEKLTRNVEEYCKRYRHPLLENFKVHSHHLESWWHTDVSSRCGCYAIYTESGELLYIGKASNSASVGSRLAAHLRHVDPAWMPAPAFVQIVEVCEPFEAPSLEEYLIRELQPRFNDRGINRRPTREPSNETPFPLKS